MITKNEIQRLIEIRHRLHAHPELSGKEQQTALFIKQELLRCNPTELKTEIGGAGLYALWDSGKPGLHSAFRAELDALPIQESQDWPYASKNKGVSHKCGHDGHATTLLGMANYIAQNPPQIGKVSLLFQPAEETGTGAEAMLKDAAMKQYKPHHIYAFHNVPGYKRNQIVLKSGPFSASVNSLIFHCIGKTAHAAEPENGINPSKVLAELLPWLQTFHQEQRQRDPIRTLALVHLVLGEQTYGTSAGNASVHITLRSATDSERKEMEQMVIHKTQELCKKHNVQCNVEQTESFAATVNDLEATQMVEEAAQKLGLEVHLKEQPFKWGEDFGLLAESYRGCLFGIGAGVDHASLHHPDYDFPDSILPTALSLFATLYRNNCFH